MTASDPIDTDPLLGPKHSDEDNEVHHPFYSMDDGNDSIESLIKHNPPYGSFTCLPAKLQKHSSKTWQHPTRNYHQKNASFSSRKSFLLTYYQSSYLVPDDSDEPADVNALSSSSFEPIKTISRILVKASVKNRVSDALFLYGIPILILALILGVPYPRDQGYYSNSSTNSSNLKISFFIMFFHGLQSAFSLALITMIFQIYSLKWWPDSLGFIATHVLVWCMSILLGCFVTVVGLHHWKLTWIIVSVVIMTVPLLLAWIKVTGERDNRHRNSTVTEADFYVADTNIWIPTSYHQFLWFTCSISLAYIGYLISESIALQYILTPPEQQYKDLIFANFFMIVIFGLNFLSEYIVANKIGWRPLQDAFCIYFNVFYYTFYRTLFIKVDSMKQALLIATTTLLVLFFNVIISTRSAYRFLMRYLNTQKSYAQHLRNIGRMNYIRGITQNFTIILIISILTILSLGNNGDFFSFFKRLNLKMALFSISVIWVVERFSSLVLGIVYKRLFNHDINNEVFRDFQKYPELYLTTILTFIHISQDMLMAFIDLKFSH